MWETLFEPLANASLLELIKQLQSLKLIHADMKCPHCPTYMCLRPRASVCDKYVWECRNYECAKYRTTLSVRYGSVFSSSKVNMYRLFKLICLWAKEISINDARQFISVTRKTIGEMYARLRQVVVREVRREPIRLGGYGVQCQVDESLFVHKQKYHVGRVAEEQIWVLGIADTSRSPCFGYMQIVDDRTEETLLPIIAEICRPGTTIASDMWRAYLNLSRKLGFEHRMVNHFLNFVNHVDGTHTQAIESHWANQKYRIKKMKG
ncbi:hypothetical protein PAPHI01_2067, partial [Pancytospora philotis]